MAYLWAGPGAHAHVFGGGWFGAMGDEPHSVARAELIGLHKALLLSSPRMDTTYIWSDCLYVVLCFRNKRYLRNGGAHEDVWSRVRHAMSNRRSDVIVQWIKAHATADEIVARGLDGTHVIGTFAADALANRGSSTAAVPTPIIDSKRRQERLAWDIRSRLGTICLHVFEKFSHEKRERSDSAWRPDQDADGLPRGILRQRLLRETQHSMVAEGNRLRCQACGQSCHSKLACKWLEANPHCLPSAVTAASVQGSSAERPAEPLLGARIQLGNRVVDPSHRLAQHRGLWWCWSCGSVGTVARGSQGLIAPCAGHPSRHGAGALKRLRAGLTYRPGLSWHAHGLVLAFLGTSSQALPCPRPVLARAAAFPEGISRQSLACPPSLVPVVSSATPLAFSIERISGCGVVHGDAYGISWR